MSAQSFIEDFRKATQAIPGFDNHRNWQDMMEIDVYAMDDREDTVCLADFNALNGFDQGHGTKGLFFMMNLADKHKVNIIGVVASGRIGEFSDAALRQWYLARGWEDDGIEPSEEEGVPDLFKVIYRPK